MKGKLKITEKGLKKRFAAETKRRVADASQEIASHLADRTAAAVREKIPDGGWFTIYKLAIQYFEDPSHAKWLVQGKFPTALSNLPADSTQIEIYGDTEIASIMKGHNPWTIDMIPSIVGGYRANAKARQASSSEVKAHRKRLTEVLPDVVDALKAAGAVIEQREFPTIAGRVYADIAFMGKRLEHGLGGLPRKPHWLPAWRELQGQAGRWALEIEGKVNPILRGLASRGPKAPPPPT